MQKRVPNDPTKINNLHLFIQKKNENTPSL